MKNILKNLLRSTSIWLVILWPSHFNIALMRKVNRIQLSSDQIKIIITTIEKKAPCRLLVFGLGNDSILWSRLNRSGVTIFLEKNIDWLHKITDRSKNIKAFPVTYNTQRKDWEKLLQSPSRLNMPLPNDVENGHWDIIFVDSPRGWHDDAPGRMKSIFLASKLANNPGDVFVHDCERQVEDIYCDRFLKKENLKKEIDSLGVILRHYHLESNST